MVRIKSLPYLQPVPGRVAVTGWEVATDNNLEQNDNLLLNWDVATPFTLHVHVCLDLENVRRDCKLSEQDTLRLAVIWQSSGTGLRGMGSYRDFDSSSSESNEILILKVNGVLFADKIRVEVRLLLPRPGKSLERFAPVMAGSLLWQEEKIYVLEGKGSRFPVELVDFSTVYYLSANAAWYLDWNADDLHQPVLGAFRLYINSAHQNVSQAINGRDQASSVIRNAIHYDVARTMIVGALCNEDFVTNAENKSYYAQDSVGLIIRDLLKTCFPTESIAALQQTHQNNPFRLECRLQDSLRLFQEM